MSLSLDHYSFAEKSFSLDGEIRFTLRSWRSKALSGSTRWEVKVQPACL